MKLSISILAALITASSAMLPDPLFPTSAEGLDLHLNIPVHWTDPDIGPPPYHEPANFFLYLIDEDHEKNCFLVGRNIPLTGLDALNTYIIRGNTVKGHVPAASSYRLRFHRKETCDHDLPNEIPPLRNNNFAQTPNRFTVQEYTST